MVTWSNSQVVTQVVEGNVMIAKFQLTGFYQIWCEQDSVHFMRTHRFSIPIIIIIIIFPSPSSSSSASTSISGLPQKSLAPPPPKPFPAHWNSLIVSGKNAKTQGRLFLIRKFECFSHLVILSSSLSFQYCTNVPLSNSYLT